MKLLSNSATSRGYPLHKMVAGAILALVCALVASCVPPLPRNVQSLGTVMDAVADREAEFGTMAVSAPILSDPGDAFEFSLREGPEDFYADAKNNIQGTASEFQQEMSSFGLQASVSYNPTLVAAYSAQLQQYLAALNKPAQSPSTKPTVADALNQYLTTSLDNASQQADPNAKLQLIQNAINTYAAMEVPSQSTPSKPSSPVFPTASIPTTAPSNLSPTTSPSNFANSQADQLFAAFQQLSNVQRSPTVTDRTALITAAGDAAVKAMFQIMGNPGIAAKFNDKRILFGVSTVSVNPGWRTSKNYAANVAITVQYKWEPARPAIMSEFIKNPQTPVDLRIRLALDQELPLPDDHAAMEEIFRCDPNLKLEANIHGTIDAIRFWNANIEEFQTAIDRPTVVKNLILPKIPRAYTYEPNSRQKPVVAAVSPLTDVQTLDLSSSFRQQEQIAVNLAFALQMAGLNAQANVLMGYARSLEQDFNTVTPDVVANSYSTGETFGFQVGPQLRAIETAKAGKYSGPGVVLERQSFPALIVYGFDGAEITPRIMVDGSSRKYVLMEPQLELTSEHNWVPLNQYWARPSESQALQLSYWLVKDFQKAKPDLDGNSLTKFATVRANALSELVFGSDSEFAIPQAIISPPRKPSVTHIEPSQIELPPPGQEKQVSIAMEGDNLDTIELDKIQLVSGGRMIDRGSDAPRRAGDVIWANVILDASDDPAPIIFSLPLASGGTYTLPIRPFTGSMPEIYGIAPQTITLESDPSGNVVPANADVFIVGRHLDLIDWQRIHPTANSLIEYTPCPPRGNNALHIQVKATSPIASLAFALPRRDGHGDIFTPPISIGNKKLSIALHSNDSGNSYDKTTATPSAPVNTKLAAPTNVKASLVAGTNQIQLAWGPSQAKSFNVYYRPDSDPSYETLLTGVTGTGEIIPRLTFNTKYHFAVAAIDTDGTGSKLIESNDITTPQSPPAIEPSHTSPSALDTPTNVSVTAANGQVTVSWIAAENASSYAIDYGKTSTVNKSVNNPSITGITNPSTSETIPGLRNGVEYYFRVLATVPGAANPIQLGLAKAIPHIAPPVDPTVSVKATVTADSKTVGLSSSSQNPGETISNFKNGSNATVEFSPGATPDEVKAFIIAATTQPSSSKDATKPGGQNSAPSLGLDVTVTQTPQSPSGNNGTNGPSNQNGKGNNGQ